MEDFITRDDIEYIEKMFNDVEGELLLLAEGDYKLTAVEQIAKLEIIKEMYNRLADYWKNN